MKVLLSFIIIGIMTFGVQAQSLAQGFRLPDIPAVLTAPEDRAAYLGIHYWDHFDFTDTSLISIPEITEQAFVDFMNVLPYLPSAKTAIDTLFRRAAAEKKMLYHFIFLSDKYLYEPNSPMCNEDLYIEVQRSLLDNPLIGEADKIRPANMLEMAMKNRPGEIASDFAFIRRDGSTGRLSEIKADYTVLYFNDPECADCRRVKNVLISSPALNRMMDSGRLCLLSVCVEGRTAGWEKAVFPPDWVDSYDAGRHLTYARVYDLKAMPTLYLLDKDKRVILKDTSAEAIEEKIHKTSL